MNIAVVVQVYFSNSTCEMTVGLIYSRVSQLQHRWHLGLDNYFCGDCPVHGKMFSGLPGLYPLYANSNPLPQVWPQKCLQTLPNRLSGAKSTPAENHWLVAHLSSFKKIIVFSVDWWFDTLYTFSQESVLFLILESNIWMVVAFLNIPYIL